MADRKIKTDEYKNNKKCSFSFSPTDITIKDDAFHGSRSSRFTEWWYFDAILDKGYSVQLSIRVLSIIKNRLVFIIPRFDIYKDGKLEKHTRKKYRLKDFHASHDIPFVKLAGKQFIKGHVDKSTGQWIYDLSFEINDASADLRFVGCTKGWKGKNPGGDGWGVMLPRATVTGKIRYNGKEINVKGVGYHDHNWEVKASAAMSNFGWYWGKINSDNYTITWATIFKTRNLGQPLLVANTKNKGYVNVKTENINFVVTDTHIENGKLLPHTFILDAHDENVSVNITMKVLDIHHVKMMLIMNYWRFHLHCKGSIKIGSKEELIDETHIAELLRFK